MKTPSEKSSIMTNRKSTTSFPISLSLRWTVYVAPNPKGGLKNYFFRFPYKNGLFSKKSATVSLCENFQRQSCKAFTGLCNRAQMVGGECPLNYVKFWARVAHPFKDGDFQSIFARSAWTIAPSERSSIITNRKSTKSFPMSRRLTVYVALLPLSPQRGLKTQGGFFSFKLDLSCKRSMLLVFWHRQHLVQSVVWPMPSPTTHPKRTHHAARFLCHSWATWT